MFKEHILSVFWNTLAKYLNYPNQKIVFSLLALLICFLLHLSGELMMKTPLLFGIEGFSLFPLGKDAK